MSTPFDPLTANGLSPFGENTQPIVHPQSPRDHTKVLVQGNELNRDSLPKIVPTGSSFDPVPFANPFPPSVEIPEVISPAQAVDKLLGGPSASSVVVSPSDKPADSSTELLGSHRDIGDKIAKEVDDSIEKLDEHVGGVAPIEGESSSDPLLDSDGPSNSPEELPMSELDSLDVVSPVQSDDDDDDMVLPEVDELPPIARIPDDVETSEPVITKAPDGFNDLDTVDDINLPAVESTSSQVDLVNEALVDEVKAIPSKLKAMAKDNKENEVANDDIPDYSAMTSDERATARHELAIKLGILRKAYPEYTIPPITEDQTVENVHDTYERWLRHIDVDNSANSYKMYLVLFWLGMELVGTKVLHVNMSGFTLNQLSIMNRYQTLLVELGERSFGGVGSDWPPEVRILLLSIVNAAVFIIFKYVSSFMGPEVASAVQSAINGIMSSEGSSKGNDMASMIANFGSMFTGGQSSTSKPKEKKRASRRPRYMD